MDSLIGINLRLWLKVLADNKFKVSPAFLPKTAFVTAYALKNHFQSAKELKLFDGQIKSIELDKEPVFILGHWRSGTTFLHNILSKDPQFAFPCLFDIRNPDTFLQKEGLFQKRLKMYAANKRMMDNVQVALDDPAEEEFAVAILTLMSPLIGWMFPARTDEYEKFATFEHIPDEAMAFWRDKYRYYLKKLTLKYQKQLLLKSPLNTGRIKYLLNMYPDAKFIHIHRNPYDVFRSTKQMYKTAVKASRFQNIELQNPDDRIIERYATMYKAFFNDIPGIPKDRFFEIRFDSLETDPESTIQSIYNTLDLGFSESFNTVLKQYLSSQKNYKKNKYSPLPDDLKQKIDLHWNFCFDKWGYDN